METEEEDLKPARSARIPWPPFLPERVRAVGDYLIQIPAPVPPETVARNFLRARVSDVRSILETLTVLGQAKTDEGSYWA
jgi:hypothetical protein